MDTRGRGHVLLLVVALALISMSLPERGLAQSPASESFEPQAVSSTAIWSTATSRVVGHLQPTVGLTTHWADDPVVLRRQSDGAERAKLIDNQLKGDLALGLGLFDRVELGLVLPITMYQNGEGAAALPSVETPTFAETRVQARVHILEAGGFGFGAQGVTYLPLPANSPYQSNGTVSGLGALVADYRSEGSIPWQIASNVGWAFEPTETSNVLASDDRLDWRVAGEVEVMPRQMHLLATVFGQWEALSDSTEPVGGEYLGGARVFWGNSGLTSTVGAGGGFGGLYGTSDVRVVASFAYAPFESGSSPSDADADGLVDARDDCVNTAEDRDGYQDEDGCPDRDNDGDAIADSDDQCANTPGVEAKDGCPETDRDGDGLADRQDGCAEEPEDEDGFEDSDGCPDPDNDSDAIADAEDECADRAEDEDGFEDSDGCPDPNNDNDRLADVDDQCPDQPETVNGQEDEDGCPDESTVEVVEKNIELGEKVYFATGESTIEQRSYGLLEDVAQLLETYPQITEIRIEGHTDNRGSATYNEKLSQRRAEAVRTFLMERGTDTSRLKAVGYGEEQPVESNDSEEGRSANRRVELEIVEVDGEPVSEGEPVQLEQSK